MQALIDTAGSRQPADRPDFKKIAQELHKFSGGQQNSSVVDKMVSRLAEHTTNLESIVAARY